MHRILVQLAETNTLVIAAIGVFGAILGALSSGLANYTIERRKRQFDLKKQIYFEAAEFFGAITLFENDENLDFERAPEMTKEEYYNKYKQEREAWWEKWSARNNVTDKLILLKYKLELCGAPKNILESIDILKRYASENNPTNMHKLIIENLIPAISEDIRKENSVWPWI